MPTPASDPRGIQPIPAPARQRKQPPHQLLQILFDFALICLFAAVLIRPFFRAEYLDKWASIESTFISDARFLVDHWPHPQWQPLWYAGTRFDYIYPPALRYGTAALVKATGHSPVRSYHIYTGFFYCIGIAGVYLLIRLATRSRNVALLGSIATAMLSPSFLIMSQLRNDAWKLLPLRLGVLVKYGEGPHMTALALIPIALAFTWLAMESRRAWAIAAAAVACALVTSNNFYGATALAVFYPVLVWSFWITRQQKRIFIPAAAIPVLAYGLTAFWLVPSYFKVTSNNLKFVSEHGTTWSIWVAVGVAIAFAIATDYFAKNKPDRTWAVFVAGCVVFFSLNILGNYFFGFRITGEPMRLVPELDMIYIMAIATLLGWMWRRPGITLRGMAIAVVVAAFATTLGYLHHVWDMFPLTPDYQSRVEYRVSDWIAKNMPDSRAYPTGSVRFWYDAWHDLAQVGGGSDQGLLNPYVEPAQWEVALGSKPEPTILWLQCLGADAVYVSDKRSQEMFKDLEFPQKLAGLLPVLFDDQSGNVLYRIPRRYAARVRVVETEKLNQQKPPRFNDDVVNLAAYAAVIEKGPESPAELTRVNTDAMRVHARLEAGQSILVQETYDTAWQATMDGKVVPVRPDAMGFMAIDAPPGEHTVDLQFMTPAENRIGRIVTLVTLLLLASLAVFGMRWERFV